MTNLSVHYFGPIDPELTFPEMQSIPLDSLPRPRIGVLHTPQVISSFDNLRELFVINLKISKFFSV